MRPVISESDCVRTDMEKANPPQSLPLGGNWDPLLANAYSIPSFREDAHRLIDLLADHLESSYSGRQERAMPWIAPEDSMQLWQALAEGGGGILELGRAMLDHSVRVTDPKFVGHQICAPVPHTLLAGLIVDCLNNGSGVYEMGMAGTAMEKMVVRTLIRTLGMPADADGFMTSGGTLANLTALLAARAAKAGPDDGSEGTRARLSLLVSDQAHYCIDRAVRIMGWGKLGAIRVPTDHRFSMCVDRLPSLFHQAVEDGRKVIAVVGCACSTSTGAFDDLKSIADFCRKHDLWFHVDGAHGAAVAFSDQHRSLVDGIGFADSVVVDFHKMLMTPAISSALIFRRQQDSFRTFAEQADYLFDRDTERLDEFNMAKRTLECTKTMLSAKVFSILAIHGTQLFAANVDRLHDLKEQFVHLLARHDLFELATHPPTNIVCFRIAPKGFSSSERTMLNERVRERLIHEGRFYIVKTVLHGQTWLRATLSNPFTSERELEELLRRLREIAIECGMPTASQSFDR